MHPTAALMLSRTIRDELERELTRRQQLSSARTTTHRPRHGMTLVEMFGARNRGLALASR